MEGAADVGVSHCRLICMRAAVAAAARMGVIIASWLSVLMGHSSPVELQMRRKGGLAGMAASPICLTCSSDGSSSINRPLMSFTGHRTQRLASSTRSQERLEAQKNEARSAFAIPPSESISRPKTSFFSPFFKIEYTGKRVACQWLELGWKIVLRVKVRLCKGIPQLAPI